MDTGLACLEGEGRLGGRVGLEDEVLVAGLPLLSSIMMITPAHSAVRVHTRCFWIGAALPPASDRQKGGSRGNSPRAELGTQTHDLAAQYSMPAQAQTVRVAPIGRTRRIPLFDPFRNITREGTGTSTDLHLADGLVQVGGVLAGWVHEPRKWPSMRRKRSSRPRLQAASLWIHSSMAPRTDIQSARETVWPVS
jgi:hypothetical protein